MFFKKAKKYAASCADERKELDSRLDEAARKLDDVLERLRKGARLKTAQLEQIRGVPRQTVGLGQHCFQKIAARLGVKSIPIAQQARCRCSNGGKGRAKIMTDRR